MVFLLRLICGAVHEVGSRRGRCISAVPPGESSGRARRQDAIGGLRDDPATDHRLCARSQHTSLVAICALHARRPDRLRGRWVAFCGCDWLVAAFSTKKGGFPGLGTSEAGSDRPDRDVLLRLGVFRGNGTIRIMRGVRVWVLFLLCSDGLCDLGPSAYRAYWGTPMTRREEPELVTSGSVSSGPTSDLFGHLDRRRRNSSGSGLVLADRRGTGWDLLLL